VITTICISALVSAIDVYNVLEITPFEFPNLGRWMQQDGEKRNFKP
jgi:hypothetical protein